MDEMDDSILHKYNLVSEHLTRLAGILQYVLCLFGTLMNILTLAQRHYSRQSCSLYLLSASVGDLIYLNLGPLSNILQYGFHYNWSVNSVVYCKSQNYLVYVSGIISATSTIFATINRFLLSSKNTGRWKYSHRRVAVRSISFTVIFWLLISIPIGICFSRFAHGSDNEQMICSNHCRDTFCLSIHVIYTCFINGVIPPLLMLFFSLLTCHNMRRIDQRSTSSLAHQTSRQLTSMIILQSVKSSFASFPFSIFNFYLFITMKRDKSALRQAKENLANQVFYLLFWSNYTSFYIYLYSSDIFRNQWIKAIKKLICCLDERRRHHLIQFQMIRTPMSALIR
jgi:hypothetical protein